MIAHSLEPRASDMQSIVCKFEYQPDIAAFGQFIHIHAPAPLSLSSARCSVTAATARRRGDFRSRDGGYFLT